MTILPCFRIHDGIHTEPQIPENSTVQQKADSDPWTGELNADVSSPLRKERLESGSNEVE